MSTLRPAPRPSPHGERPPRPTPLEGGHWLLGNLPEFRRDTLGLVARLAREHQEIVRVRFLKRSYYFVHHPDGIKHVLQDRNANYPKSRNYDKMKVFLGEGLLTSDGEFWRRQRRIAQPGFHRQRLAALADRMIAAADATVGRLGAVARAGGSLDITTEMLRLSLDAAATALFSSEVGIDEARTISEALVVAQNDADTRIQSIIDWPLFLPTRLNRAARRAVAALDRIVFRMIDAHRRASPRPDDLLTMLIEATDGETGGGMSDRELRDEAMTIFLAGHETTAVCLSWTLYLLSKHPEVVARLRAEHAAALGDRDPGLGDLKQLAYSGRVIEESMRLYPPAWIIERRSLEPDVILGHAIPAGAPIVLAPWSVHRSPWLWQRPEEFDPDRFLPERAAGRPRYAYFPFGGGPRQCIGKEFALMELQLALPRLVRAFDFELAQREPIAMNPQVTLRPADGIRLKPIARPAAS